MLELVDIAAATGSTFACLVYLRRPRLCAVRVTLRDTWLTMDKKTSNDIFKLARTPTHDSRYHALSYCAVLHMLDANGANPIANELRRQMRNAIAPTHSHAPANWRPSKPLSKTAIPAYESHYYLSERVKKRGRKKGHQNESQNHRHPVR